MADIASLTDKLKRDASIDESEGFSDVEDLGTWIEEAIRQHRRDASVDSIPVEEEELVILLAWAKVCIVRANKFAKLASTSGGQGFASDRNSPYYKNMNLSMKLVERYKMLVENLGVDDVGTDILQGYTHKREELLGVIAPASTSLAPPRIVLSMEEGESATVGTTLIIKWTMREYDDFADFYLFHLQSASESILQKWNYNSSTGYSGLHDNAERLFGTARQDVKTVKIADIDKTLKQRYAIVCASRSGRHTISNELIIGP